jgi:rRNA biogenesis protein RRP5
MMLTGSWPHSETFTTDLSRLFAVGKVVQVRIISVDHATGKIFASMRQGRQGSSAPAGSIDSVEVGNVLSGEVVAMHDANIVLSLLPSRAKALISLAMLARHKGTDVDTLRTEITKGSVLSDLVVVSKNAAKELVIVGLLPSKAANASSPEAHLNNLTFDKMVVGQRLQGRVSSRAMGGLIVQLSRTIRGRVSKTELADDYDQLKEPATGSFVQCVVLSIDSDNHRAELSLRPSRQDVAAAKVRDVAVNSIEELCPGQNIRGYVKNIANHGVFVELGYGVTARVQIKVSTLREMVLRKQLTKFCRIQELFDEFVKDWKPRFTVGKLVEGKITAYVVA